MPQRYTITIDKKDENNNVVGSALVISEFDADYQELESLFSEAITTITDKHVAKAPTQLDLFE